ncbi:MAG: DUF1624 domain-containing protein [Burkholderiales bacterium]|nr:DUF1624 domain-containing protein [Burkholderiales bacterium]
MTTRFRSLDAFRGATVALMIVVNNPGSFRAVYPPLAHADWHGCTPTDLVFPFFLFAVGNALACSMPGLERLPAAELAGKLARRVALIFGLGLLLNAAPFVRWDAQGELAWRSLDTLRLMGVLQRIALAWGAAVLIVRATGQRGVLWWVAGLLLGYWAACVGLGDAADPYSLQGWFGTALDRGLLGTSHLYRGEGVPFDPEGLASTAPAVAQVLLGYWVGERLLRQPLDAQALRWLAGMALGLFAAAFAWQFVMPVNKKLWTSPYVLLSTAWALVLLAGLIFHVEGRGRDGVVLRAAELFGRHALPVYVASGLVPRCQALLRWHDGVNTTGSTRFTNPMDWAWHTVFEPLAADPRQGSLLFALANLAGYWLLALAIDRLVARRRPATSRR